MKSKDRELDKLLRQVEAGKEAQEGAAAAATKAVAGAEEASKKVEASLAQARVRAGAEAR